MHIIRYICLPKGFASLWFGAFRAFFETICSRKAASMLELNLSVLLVAQDPTSQLAKIIDGYLLFMCIKSS